MTPEEITEVIDDASEKAWRRDQEITIKYSDGTTNLEVTVKPEQDDDDDYVVTTVSSSGTNHHIGFWGWVAIVIVAAIAFNAFS